METRGRRVGEISTRFPSSPFSLLASGWNGTGSPHPTSDGSGTIGWSGAGVERRWSWTGVLQRKASPPAPQDHLCGSRVVHRSLVPFDPVPDRRWV
eukprot:scaffold1060_cov385-Pavlova_lutheri.AAC.3